MKDQRLRLIAQNTMAAVGEATAVLESFLGGHGVDQEVVLSAVLILEEILTNIVKYSHCDGLSHEIQVEVSLEGGELTIGVTDDGREFDPRAAPAPDLEKDLEDRPVGGLGIHLLRRLARRLDYERVEGRNVLRVFVSLESPDGSQRPERE